MIFYYGGNFEKHWPTQNHHWYQNDNFMKRIKKDALLAERNMLASLVVEH